MLQASDRLVQICWRMYELNKDLAHGNDEQRRNLTRMIAEQCKFERLYFDFGEIGTKSSTPTHPPSKDAIAVGTFLGKLFIWDWQNGTSREPQIVEGSHAEEVTGQHFIAVIPFNHLIVVPPVEPPIPTPIPGHDEVIERLIHLDKRFNLIESMLDDIRNFLDEGIAVVIRPEHFPNYEGDVRFLGKVTLVPKQK